MSQVLRRQGRLYNCSPSPRQYSTLVSVPGIGHATIILSACTRGLPADALCWDLSKLLIEGQPVQHSTVIAYLNSAYQHVRGETFQEAPQPQQEVPANHRKQQGEPEQQAPAQAAAGVTTFAAITQLLLFADAVGSTSPLLRACAAGIGDLSLHVQPPTGPPLALSIRTPNYWDFSSSSSTKLAKITESQGVELLATFSTADAPAKAALVQQVQAQTEALLYAAYKLELSAAAEAVQGFIRMQTCFEQSLLYGAMRPVLSSRVIDAAAGYRSLQETLLLNHLITQPCSFTACAVSTALVPTDLPEKLRQPLKFRAEVVQDLLGCTTELQGRIPTEVDILNHRLKLGLQTYEAYVVLGPMVCSEDAKQAVLGTPTPTTD